MKLQLQKMKHLRIQDLPDHIQSKARDVTGELEFEPYTGSDQRRFVLHRGVPIFVLLCGGSHFGVFEDFLIDGKTKTVLRIFEVEDHG